MASKQSLRQMEMGYRERFSGGHADAPAKPNAARDRNNESAEMESNEAQGEVTRWKRGQWGYSPRRPQRPRLVS